MQKKISKWTIFTLKLYDDWQSLWIRKRIRIFWTYIKLAWALSFVTDEFSKLLNMDTNGMFAMSSYQKERYQIILSKIRDKIGDHGSKKNYTLKKFLKDVLKKNCTEPNLYWL